MSASSFDRPSHSYAAGPRTTTAAPTRRVVEPALPATKGRVLIVDDIAGDVGVLKTLLEHDGYLVASTTAGWDVLARIAKELPDLILMEVMTPDLDVFEACRRLKSDPSTRLLPVVLITALRAGDDRIRGLEAGADDFITKPFNAHELRARVRSLIRIKRYTDELDTAESVIVSLALTIEARDRSTDGHCHRLAAYAGALGAHLGLGEEDLGALAQGGFLHDIGKVGVPDALLLKPAPLTRQEYEQVKAHTVIGDRLCGELRSLRRVRSVVRSHHERLDGSGYPDGLRGDSIPLLAQILAVVDVFDALTTRRPYKEALSQEQAIGELTREVERGWRRGDLVDALIELLCSGRLPRFRS